MRQFLLTVVALLVASCGFANNLSDSAAIKKSSSALRAAWTKHNHSQAQQLSNDITMVYGGADVANEQQVIAPVAIG